MKFDFNDSQEISYLLALDKLLRVGQKNLKFEKLLAFFGSFKNVWFASPGKLESTNIFTPKALDNLSYYKSQINPAELVENYQKANIHFVIHGQPSYPKSLNEIHHPPLVLYSNRSLDDLDLFRSIALVGTRNPSFYGKNMAKMFAKFLSLNSFVIVSGLANGIDSVCHKECLKNNAITVAVLGCGIDQCYPPQQAELYNEIKEKGFLISEYCPGTSPTQWQFPERNRIISGLSQATLVIEAPGKSGSLITAKFAFEQNKSVFAIPGNIDTITSFGTNSLIADNIAKLVVEPNDILLDLNIYNNLESSDINSECSLKNNINLTSQEKEVLSTIESCGQIQFDELCSSTGLSSGSLSSILTILEINNLVQKITGNYYVKI